MSDKSLASEARSLAEQAKEDQKVAEEVKKRGQCAELQQSRLKIAEGAIIALPAAIEEIARKGGHEIRSLSLSDEDKRKCPRIESHFDIVEKWAKENGFNCTTIRSESEFAHDLGCWIGFDGHVLVISW